MAEYGPMSDLGTLHGASSIGIAIDTTWVIGIATEADGSARSFAVDLRARPRTMVDLGSLGLGDARAGDIDGTWVVGNAGVRADPTVDAAASGRATVEHAFAYNLAASHPAMIDLSAVGGGRAKSKREALRLRLP